MSTSSRAGSRVRTSPTPAPAKGSPVPGPDSGRQWPTAFACYDRDGSCWRTWEPSGTEESTVYSGTWPRSGTTWNGIAYPLPPSAPLTAVTGGSRSRGWATPWASDPEKGGRGDLLAQVRTGRSSGRKSWPTPTTADATGGPGGHRSGGDNLRTAVAKQQWPTPTARTSLRGVSSEPAAVRRYGEGRRNLDDAVALPKQWPTPMYRDGTRGQGVDAPGRPLSERARGVLNPDWVECLMGFPPGWTDLSDNPDGPPA